METVLAFVIGGLYAAALYLMLRRNVGQLILGLALLTNATNLLIFTAAGLTRENPPLILPGETRPPEPFADPLPQALILTAIVIGFAVVAFALVLSFRTYQVLQTDDLDEMNQTDRI